MATNSNNDKSVFLPSPHQEHLLAACLFEGADAISAWHRWRADTNLDDIDFGSLRLLPLLAHNLRKQGLTDVAFKKFRGVEKRAWVVNHLLVQAAARAAKQLNAASIPAMALKGVVLASTYYEVMSLRPMDDFDVLVPPEHGAKALDLFENLGWRIVPGQMRPRAPTDFAIRAAVGLENPEVREIQVDLHWRLFWARYSDEAEKAFWDRAVTFKIGETQCLAPCAADMLMHICAHGAMWNDIPPVRWVSDGALIVRSGNVDWTHLLRQTERLGLTLPLGETLKYLNSVMRVPIPGDVIQKIMRSRVKRIDRLIYMARLRPPNQWSLLTTLRLHSHIARHEATIIRQPLTYWRYFFTLIRGRPLSHLLLWLHNRLAKNKQNRFTTRP